MRGRCCSPAQPGNLGAAAPQTPTLGAAAPQTPCNLRAPPPEPWEGPGTQDLMPGAGSGRAQGAQGSPGAGRGQPGLGSGPGRAWKGSGGPGLPRGSQGVGVSNPGSERPQSGTKVLPCF